MSCDADITSTKILISLHEWCRKRIAYSSFLLQFCLFPTLSHKDITSFSCCKFINLGRYSGYCTVVASNFTLDTSLVGNWISFTEGRIEETAVFSQDHLSNQIAERNCLSQQQNSSPPMTHYLLKSVQLFKPDIFYTVAINSNNLRIQSNSSSNHLQC